jgi:hypothetical protein
VVGEKALPVGLEVEHEHRGRRRAQRGSASASHIKASNALISAGPPHLRSSASTPSSIAWVLAIGVRFSTDLLVGLAFARRDAALASGEARRLMPRPARRRAPVGAGHGRPRPRRARP